MRRLAPSLVLLVLAACRGEGSDPRCSQARALYIQHQVEAVDRAIAATPSPEKRNLLASQARDEVNEAERRFASACEEMDGGKLLACLRTEASMNAPDCEPVAAELRRRMTP